jgi:hypothetical protein
MAGSTITGLVSSTVTIGGGLYVSPLTITSTGTVAPAAYGAVGVTGGAAAVLINQGSIEGGNGTLSAAAAGGTGGNGVNLAGGTLTTSGHILGGNGGAGATYNGAGGTGVSFSGAGTLTNSGTISGGAGGAGAGSGAYGGNGVYGNRLLLINYGTISGGEGLDGYNMGGAGLQLESGTLVNHGLIVGGQASVSYGEGGVGVYLYGSSAQNDATVMGGAGNLGGSGGYGVVVASQNNSFTNAGGITGGVGGSGSSVGGRGGDGVLSYYTGNLLMTGTVTGGAGGTGTLQGGEGGVGVLLGGGTLTAFGTISGGAGGASAGNAGVAGDAVDIVNAPATVVVEPLAVFDGNVQAAPHYGDTLELAGISSATLSGLGTQFTGFDALEFASGASWTVKSTLAALDNGQVISGFATSDKIILKGFVETSATFVAGTGLELGSLSGQKTIGFIGTYTGETFSVSTDGTNTTIALCYLAGTRILTPQGEKPVEQLAIGDSVVTHFGGVQAIRWLGRQAYPAGTSPLDGPPVLIRAGALGNGVPARDLRVSPGHSMLVDGVLVLARSLVNGITVTQDPHPDAISYVSIDLAAHDCVCAEGAWSETFADEGQMRARFDNHAEFAALHPQYVAPPSVRLCAPRPLRGKALDQALRAVVGRASLGLEPGPLSGSIDLLDGNGHIHGWAHDSAHPELPVLLHVRVDGEMIGSVLACDKRDDLVAAGIGKGRCSFVFESPIRLTTRALASLRIERGADGAKLPISEACAAQHTPPLRLAG